MSFINIRAPNFRLEGYFNNKIIKYNTSDHICRNKNLLMIFYPSNYQIICPSEILAISDHKDKFDKNNTDVIFISRDSVYSHKNYTEQSRENNGVKDITYPLLSDINNNVSGYYDIINIKTSLPDRGIVIINKKGIIKHYSTYCKDIGRSLKELLYFTEKIDEIKN